jgi:GxxExxY protein
LVYKGRTIEKRYVPDLYISKSIVVEWKSCKELIPDYEAQLFNYMRIARQPVGYLINFGTKDDLQWQRLILSDIRKLPPLLD